MRSYRTIDVLVQTSLQPAHNTPSTFTPLQVALERLTLFGSAVSCSSFVEVKGQLYCSIEELASNLDSANNETTPTYGFDHTHPSSDKDAPVAVLYAELGTAEFAAMHVAMTMMATEGTLRYVLRHYESVSCSYWNYVWLVIHVYVYAVTFKVGLESLSA